MRITTIAIAAFALVASVDLAISSCRAEEAPAAGPYEVLKPGDRDMSCQQLASEANSLNATILAQQNKPHDDGAGRKVSGAVAGGLLKSAGRFGLARFGGGFGGIGGAVARAAADTAADTAGQAIAGGGEDSSQSQAAPTVTPQQQRMNHLLSLYKEKNC